MASLKKRNRTWYIRFFRSENGNEERRTLSLGTNYKKIAEEKQKELERLVQAGYIDPFHPDFSIEAALNAGKNSSVYTLDQAFDKFIQSKNHLKDRTIEFYKNNINHFFDHQDVRSILPDKLSSTQVESFLFRGGIEVPSIHANARALRAFFNYMQSKDWIRKSPMDSIKLPELKTNYHHKMLTKKELDLLFSFFDRHQAEVSKEKWFREHHRQDWFKPLMATYFYTGMRLHEAAFSPKLSYSGLKGLNILEDCTVFYLGSTKGTKERFIPISKYLRPFLIEYFKVRGVPGPNDYVFIHKGGRYDEEPVRGKAAREVFNDYCSKAGIDEAKTMHGLRHQRVTQWIKDGFSIKEASMMAGHSSTAVTEGVYTHLAFKDLREKMNRIEDE